MPAQISVMVMGHEASGCPWSRSGSTRRCPEGRASFVPELLFEARLGFPAELFHPGRGSRLELGVVFVLPGAGRLVERLFLAGDEERLADRIGDEAAALALLDQAVEIGADLFGKRDVGA